MRITKHWHAHRRPCYQRSISWCKYSLIAEVSLINDEKICSAQVPVYISELAPPSKRGRLVGSQQWAITWGISKLHIPSYATTSFMLSFCRSFAEFVIRIVIMFYISYGCSYIHGTAAFRIPWGLQMIPAILLFIGLMFLPESPRWLAKNDRWEESLDVLVLCHGQGDPNSVYVTHEMQEIKESIEFDNQNSDVSWKELFNKTMLNRLHIGIFTQVSFHVLINV